MVFVKVLIAWLLADFFTGAVHWFEDRYMDVHNLNLLNSIATENDLHHRKPTAMTLSSGWVNMRSGAAVGWPVAALLWYLGSPLIVWLVPFFASFGNLVHRWSHMPKAKLPRWIRGMQEFGLFISHEHHDAHHRAMQKLIPKYRASMKYCPMTDWVNPTIDVIGFWEFLESLLRRLGFQTTLEKRQTSAIDLGT